MRTARKNRVKVNDRLIQKIARERTTPAPTKFDGRLVNIHRAAERLGLSVWTLRKWASLGKLSYRRVGRRVMVTEDEIARLAGAEVIATVEAA